MADLLIGVALAVVTRYSDLGVTACGLHTSQINGPWLAVPHEQLGDRYHCGDLVILRGEDWWYQGTVQDTGYLSEHCVRYPGGCSPILFDIPTMHAPFTGLSARVVEAYNVTAEVRRGD